MTLGSYVHVPFCERVCPYCDFAVVARRRLSISEETAYVEALLRELELRQKVFAGRTLETVYFGGGTPALLTPVSLARLLKALHDAFPRQPEPVRMAHRSATNPGKKHELEVTLEINPSTLERERLPDFREAGVNRLSIGVQSWNNRSLKRLGRAHRAAESDLTLAACRRAGFDNLSLDLLFAHPEQTLADLESDLARAIDFGPEHVSTYELTVETGTPYATAVARNRFHLPEEVEAVQMHEMIERRLTAAGFVRYELSNYARHGCESRHNQRYWRRQPVLALGVGASSLDPPGADAPYGVRRTNVRELSRYMACLAEGTEAEAEPVDVLDASTARAETIFLALRTREGLRAQIFAGAFGAPPRFFFEREISGLIAQDWLAEDSAGDLALTPRGRLFSDSVFAEFMPAR